MSFLGYDRELLNALFDAMRRSSDELAALDSADPQAVDAMHVVRSSRLLLDQEWLPLLGGLLACVALDERRPVRLDPTDLRAAAFAGHQRERWQIVTDPLPGTVMSTVSLVDEARAIGAGLIDPSITGELTMDELTWLVDRLHVIAADPMARRALRDSIGGDDQWADLLDRLGLDRLEHAGRLLDDPENRASADRLSVLDRVSAGLAIVYSSGPHTARGGWYPTVIGLLDPYSAAVLLAQMDLDPDVAATAATQVLTRWLEGNDGRRMWGDPWSAGDNAADVLFRWLATDAAAARAFVERARRRPELLFRTTYDDASVVAVVAAATDPDQVAADVAGWLIMPLIDWNAAHGMLTVPTDGGVHNMRVVLATILAPWLLQLTARTDDWSWSPRAADATLRWVIEDEHAATRLVASMGAWQQNLAATPFVDDAGRLNDAVLHDLAQLFAKLQVAFRDEELADAVAAAFWRDASFFVVQILVSAFVAGPAASIAADLTFATLGAVAGTFLDDLVTQSPAGPSDGASARFGSRAADTAVIAVVSIVGQLVQNGRLPADALDALRLGDLDDDECTAGVVDERLREFVHGLSDSTDAATHNALVAVVNLFSNPLSIEQQC
jgi:hypothetical protein